MAISPRDLYLSQHPTLARLVAAGDAQALTKFLHNNAGIATAWQRVKDARTATLPSPAGAAPTPAAPAATTAPNVQQQQVNTAPAPDMSAKASIEKFLAGAGLGGLGAAAWQRYLETDSATFVMEEIRSGAAWTNGVYKQRFPGIRPGMDEGDYVRAENTYRQKMRQYGLPETFYDQPDDFAKLIERDVSADEFESRLEMRAQVVAASPKAAAMRDELASKYGLADAEGMTLAYWIDPDKATELIKKQFRAAESSAISRQAGFGALTTAEAERVGAGGYSEQFLTQQFGKIAGMDEFLVDLPGGADDNVTREDLIAAGVEGNADASQRIETTRRKRQANFAGGGGYAAGQGGISGLGSA